MSWFASATFKEAVHSIGYSTHFRDVCCCGTFDLNHWYHGGMIHVCLVTQNNSDDKPTIKTLANLNNGTGINKLIWSEIFKELIATANYDGSTYPIK